MAEAQVIPVHPGEELGRGILTEIMSDIGFQQEGVS